MSPLRVLVADDSLTVRRRIADALEHSGDFEVLGEAADGREAVDLCRSLRPDVVTLDMAMPVMSGLEATEQIMAFCPTPILIVSASTNRGELFRTYEALSAGALDVLEKPLAPDDGDAWDARLAATLRLLARIRVITHPRARLAQGPRPPEGAEDTKTAAASPSGAPQLVAIGASTGGPGAVREILRGLSADFPLPILVVLHLGAAFSGALAEWLNHESPLPVAFAEDGEVLPVPGRGRVLLAPPDRHLVLREARLRLSAEPPLHSCRPSVDLLFQSLALGMGPAVAACLLTGMGRDGAQGLLALRRAGAYTAAQDEASSVVYGMPREAVLIGAAARVLPLDQFAPSLSRLALPRRERQP